MLRVEALSGEAGAQGPLLGERGGGSGGPRAAALGGGVCWGGPSWGVCLAPPAGPHLMVHKSPCPSSRSRS